MSALRFAGKWQNVMWPEPIRMDKLERALQTHFASDATTFDLIHQYGDPRQTLLAFRIYWPAFATVEGQIVLAESVADSRARERLVAALGAGDTTVLESFRWTEVPYLFADRTLPEKDDRLLADLMCITWRAALMVEYPERQWVTRVLQPHETGSAIGVAFEEAQP